MRCSGKNGVLLGATLINSGKHTVRVVAIDLSGNVAERTYIVNVDAKPQLAVKVPELIRTEEDLLKSR